MVSKMITKEELENLKEKYPIGCRVKLLKMEDPQPVPIGTMGTVLGIDSLGDLLMAWDNGSSLNVVYNEDKVVRIRKCPICNEEYEGYPAISRYDGKTEICSRCANIESMKVIGMPQNEIGKIMNKIDSIEKDIKNEI